MNTADYCGKVEAADWPYQIRAHKMTVSAIRKGPQRIVLVGPTGCGKTRITMNLTRWAIKTGRKVLILTNRKMIREQTSSVLDECGIPHGVRAGNISPDFASPIQVSSLQTETSRVYRRRDWPLHEADLVLIDEPHACKGPSLARLMDAYSERGASLVGTTATPRRLARYFHRLFVVANNSECIKIGAHVPCLSFAQTGDVLDGWRELNPESLPTIGFASGVKQSLALAQRFSASGIRSAHIDGEHVWLDGQLRRSNQQVRLELRDGSQNGSIPIIWNRFVLREGVNFPWLAHCIMACRFLRKETYLQAGGRLLRSYPGLDHVTLQDHAANVAKHGSLNADHRFAPFKRRLPD